MKSCKQGLLAIIAVVAMASASATPGNNGGGNGGCGVGQQTNGCGGGTTPAPSSGSATSTSTGVGVGVGVGIGVGQGGSAAVTNSNTNSASQAQGQSQSSRNSNSNRNSATGGNGTSSSNATGGASTATGGQATGGSSGGNTFTVEGAKGDVTYAPAQERAPVATAYAAPLVSTNGTCMGSSSAGGQGAALGLSFGTTWTDNNCDIRYDAEALRAAGLNGAAQARLCQKPEIAKAMEAAGTPCPGVRTSAVPAPVKAAEADEKAPFSDPIIRRRLGLPPL